MYYTGLRMKNVSFRIVPLFLCIVSFLASGCSLDYSKAMVAEDLSEKIPDTSFNDFKDVRIKDNTIVNKLEAGRAETFGKQKKTIFSGLHFTQLDSKGVVLTEGWADSVILHSDTENAELSGNIRFYSAADEITITADALYWENEKKRLYSDPDKEVRLLKSDGSFLNGKGFEAFLNKRLINFQQGVSGSYVTGGEGADEGR
jgi:LPS export ABC transporter protein LptC